MIGAFGDITFESNDQRILTFTGFQRDSSSRFATHEVIQKKPVTEFLGPDLDTISFTIQLSGAFGVKPREEMEKWLRKNREGHAETLVIGNKGLGYDKWIVTSVSQMWDVIFNKGEVYSGRVDIEIQEYVEVLR